MTPKKGFRKIDNGTFKALIAVGLTGAGYQIVLTIIDRTLGFRKGSGYKEKASISLTHFEKVTGLSRQSVRLAIKQAEKRHIISVERDSTKPTIYALNLDTREWVTRRLNHPSELDNVIIPDWATNSPYARKLAMSNCIPTKETLKENFKERDTSKEKVTNNISVRGTPPYNPPPLKEDTKDTTFKTIVESTGGTGSERALKDSTLTHGDLIENFLRSFGPAPIKTISQATGIDRNSVNTTLHLAKGKRFQHLPVKRAWCMANKELT